LYLASRNIHPSLGQFTLIFLEHLEAGEFQINFSKFGYREYTVKTKTMLAETDLPEYDAICIRVVVFSSRIVQSSVDFKLG
jgi:hypothetical protein